MAGRHRRQGEEAVLGQRQSLLQADLIGSVGAVTALCMLPRDMATMDDRCRRLPRAGEFARGLLKVAGVVFERCRHVEQTGPRRIRHHVLGEGAQLVGAAPPIHRSVKKAGHATVTERRRLGFHPICPVPVMTAPQRSARGTADAQPKRSVN
jgi:hypothetical protein